MCRVLLIYTLLSVGWVIAQAQESSRVVNISQGPVRGYRISDTEVFAFYGIPYATAPSGTDKFKAPLPPPKWTETFEATNRNIRCLQPGATTGNLNCLIANIYIPDTNKTDLPVMVSVHGGVYLFGHGDADVPTSLVSTKEIIVVSFNYRLGVIGFLCLGTKEVPGNAGMKDQIAALKWVKDNIREFGGNPNDITIAGCSAGGVSVDLLRISSMADGLFQKVIVGSGGNAGLFGIQIDPTENAKWYAKELNFDNVDDVSALAAFYTSASEETLLSRYDVLMGRPDAYLPIVPCVEKDLGEEMFLNDAPVNILKNGKNNPLTVLYGFTDKEGLMFLMNFNDSIDGMIANFSNFLPSNLKFDSDNEKEEIAKRVKEFYFGDKPVSKETVLGYIDYYTDIGFAHSMLRSVKLNAEASNSSTMYVYEYSFVDENTPFILDTNYKGATHCTQFGAFFDENESSITEEYRSMKSLMRRLVLDFVTTGNPVPSSSALPSWPPANGDRNPHMSLGVNVTLQGPLVPERAKLWDEIYEKHYLTPIPPGNTATKVVITNTIWVMCSLWLFLANY